MTSRSDPLSAISDWLQELRERGAVLEADGTLRFGEPERERAALLTVPTLHPLIHCSLLRAAGPDAGTFLQGQLSNDVDMLDATHAQLSTYCTPQGRMLASLLLWRDGSVYTMLVPAQLAEGVRARLQKHVLRAKVTLSDATAQMRVLGLGGPGAAAALAALVPELPMSAWDMARGTQAKVVRLPGELFLVLAPRDHWPAAWEELTRLARPAGTEGWRWRLIAAGIPVITADTQEQFVPQMANFEQLGAISFSKGCYPGQEIIARAEYRGEVKRRLFRLHAPDAAAAAGQPIFRAGDGAACGTVLNAAPAPGGGFDLLAVVLTDAARAGALRLGGGAPVYPCP